MFLVQRVVLGFCGEQTPLSHLTVDDYHRFRCAFVVCRLSQPQMSAPHAMVHQHHRSAPSFDWRSRKTAAQNSHNGHIWQCADIHRKSMPEQLSMSPTVTPQRLHLRPAWFRHHVIRPYELPHLMINSHAMIVTNAKIMQKWCWGHTKKNRK